MNYMNYTITITDDNNWTANNGVHTETGQGTTPALAMLAAKAWVREQCRTGIRPAGNYRRGEESTVSGLTNRLVYEIRYGQYKGQTSVDVAKILGVSHSTIRNVRLRRVWKHVP